MAYRLKINGEFRELDAEGDTPLLWVLRDDLALTGSKYGCGAGLCGACTVHLGGVAIRSCTIPIEAVSEEVTTIEAVSGPEARALQEAWIANDVPQCGYCQSGQIMSAVALLRANPGPSDQDIDDAMNGNICRCGTYQRIRAAIHAAASALPDRQD